MRDPTLASRSVLVIHPLPLLAEALGALVEDAGCVLAGQCSDAACVRRLLFDSDVDVVLFDAALAASTLPEIVRSQAPDARLVMLASAIDGPTASWGVARDLDGVVLCSATAEQLADVVARVCDGQAVFPAGWLAAVRAASNATQQLPLSERQLEVLSLLADGLSNDEIARRLVISTNTVKFHIAAIYERLGVHTRVEAAAALAGREPLPLVGRG